MSTIEFSNVSFQYPNTKEFVFQSLNWNQSKAEIIGLVGANGSGKSTFFRLLAGILRPSEGEIYIGGNLIKDIKQTRQIISIVPENAKLFLMGPTGLEDFVRIRHKTENVDRFFANYNLLEIARERIYHLSEGQRRLLALVLAFQLPRQILLFDEPTIGLDSYGRSLILDLAKQAVQNNKIVIMATNDPRIYPLVDNLIILGKKSIVMNGEPKDVLYRLESETSLYPNQLVRAIQKFQREFPEYPSYTSIDELNDAISRRNLESHGT